MNPLILKLLPHFAIALVLGGIVFGIHHHGVASGRWEVQAKWDKQKMADETAKNKAIAARIAENAALEDQYRRQNADITKAKNEELATIRARLAASERMRVPKFCGSAAPGQSKAESPSGSNGVDPGARVLPASVEQNIRALILQTEEVAATARACQNFVRDNGLVP